MIDFRVDIGKTHAYLFTPYNPEFVSSIKMIGGANWDPLRKAWAVPVEMVEEARTIMRNIYGCDDTTSTEYVSVIVTIGDDPIYELHRPVMMFGKIVAKAYGRDSGAVPGDGVAYLKGRCYSSGSAKNWASEIEANSVIKLIHVNKNLFDKEMSEKKDPGFTVTATAEEPHINSLMAERARLVNRLEEINEELKDESRS